MSDHLDDLRSTVDAILLRYAGRGERVKEGGFLATAWAVLEESGMTTIGALENEVGLAELAVVARCVGRAAAAVPLVESGGLAVPLLTASGLEVPPGLLTMAVHPKDEVELERHGDVWRARARLVRVPWGRQASSVTALAVVEGIQHVVVLPVGAIHPGENLAGEPRDGLVIEAELPASAVAVSALSAETVRLHGAVLRAASMVGAMESVRGLTLAHASTREQFGRPISAFQAVQHHLVAVASETICSSMAVDLAVAASPGQLAFAGAAAKATAGRSADVVARAAHQVHAAIGVTDEHALPWYTTRLWSWRDEIGPTAEWALSLGLAVTEGEPQDLWHAVTRSAGELSPAEVVS